MLNNIEEASIFSWWQTRVWIWKHKGKTQQYFRWDVLFSVYKEYLSIYRTKMHTFTSNMCQFAFCSTLKCAQNNFKGRTAIPLCLNACLFIDNSSCACAFSYLVLCLILRSYSKRCQRNIEVMIEIKIINW